LARKLIVEIIGDDKSLQRAFNRSTTSANKFGTAVEKVQRRAGVFDKFARGGAATFAGGAAAATAIRFLDQSIEAASALEEQINKSRVVLGAASAEVEAFGRISAEELGISNRAAVEAAGSFAGLFTTIGTGQREAAALGVQLTRLAGDLASFFDVGTDEALTALRSGLVGEAEPLRRFNVLLSEARVQQEAFTKTGKTSVDQLTEQDKVLARIAIIMRETADAQGDVSRTADSLANKQRKLNAEFEDTRARIGKLILPLKVQLVGALTEATDVAEDLVGVLEALSKVQIPTITIPVVGEFGGGKAGDIAKMALGLLNPKDILIPVRIIRAVRGGGDDDDSPESSIKNIGDALSKGLTDAQSGLKKFQDRVTGSGKGFVDFLDAVNNVISSTEAAVAKAEAHADALERLQRAADTAALAVDRVGLALDQASATPTLRDDIAAFEAIGRALQVQEDALRAQIGLNRENAALQSQLVSVQGQQIQNEQALAAAVKQRAANQAAAAAEARQAAQFRALGLTGEGDRPIPTIDNLTRQLDQLDAKIAGGKNQKVLNAIRKVLTDPVNKATEETRQAIREMFATIRGELDDGLKGPLTATSGLNTKKIIDGLGLDAVTAQEIRSRLSGFNTAGRALAGATQSNFVPGAALGVGLGAIVVENHNTLEVDGEVVARSVTRSQQKTRRRNPQQKRGPNRIGGV
jgi:hypothetical protein